jgi:oligoendopeptidase F
LRDQFGDSVEVSDEFRWEWISIPHIFHTPFTFMPMPLGSCWCYPFTNSTKPKGEAFKPRYLKILSAGGSAAPEQVLAEAGIDIHQADFWQGGFDVIWLVDRTARENCGVTYSK